MNVPGVLFAIIFISHSYVLQAQDTTMNKVSFVVKIDIQQATKDGIYLNGYVINIPYDKLQKLNGKTVRITGKVTIIEGNMYSTDEEIRQGREEDTKHILKPKIKVVDD